MKWKKGICLILCIWLLTGLAPLRAFAAPGECVDGVWSSITLTGGANKVIFSADSGIENQILHPDGLTAAQYILPEGISYDEQSNTLILTDFREPTANLVLTMMGSDFKIRLNGSSSLASICSESKGRGGSISFCGDGALDLGGAETAILVRADGAPDFVSIEPQVRLTASSAYGSAIRVIGTARADSVICFDTSDPQVIAYDCSRAIGDVTTTDGRTLELRSLPGAEGLFGLEAVPVLDEEGERIVYNVYPLGQPDADGRYPAGEALEEQLTDVSSYQSVYTPHDWILVDLGSGATAPRARFARFAISARALDDNGTLSISQSTVARGGNVEVNAVPNEGYKLAALMVNGSAVTTANGSYVIGGITADQTVTASFAAAAPTHIRVTAPAQTDFKVPAPSAGAFVSEPFRAVVTDGADDPVGASVSWSIAPETQGVSIDGDGRVTVTSAAMSAAAEPLSFTVMAEVKGTNLIDASSGFTVSLAERKAAEIHLTRSGEALGESDTVLIPAAGEITKQQYGAVLFDQYGSRREEEIVWSAGDWPAGVRRDGDTLTVYDNCSDGSTLVVTAAASSDKAVSASVTVKFAVPIVPQEETKSEEPKPEETKPEETKPEETKPEDTKPEDTKPEETKAEEKKPEETKREEPKRDAPTREAPVITWPTVTLAADPVYGISWTDLVTLSGGSATLGGETLEGSFALSAENTQPNVSDSFRIAFTYSDGEEIKTVESETQSVTLAPRAIGANMITLTPDSAPYTGAAIEPEVSLRDGERSLTAGTDFSVTGYSNNIEISTDDAKAVVTVQGLGNYGGTATKSFTITRKPLDAAMVTLSPSEMPYTGTAREPAVSLKDGDRALVAGTDFSVTGYANNIEIGTGSVMIEGLGNYSGTVTKNFTITAIPGSGVTSSVTSCKPEDEGITPAIVLKDGDTALVEGKDYDLSLQYDIPAKSGTATVTFKGKYSGTRILAFDLPNYLITEGAGSSWTKGTAVTLNFKANGALGKFKELTVDGKTVPTSGYSVASGSTIVKIKPDYLKTLTAGKHIVGVAYKDGKALAIFSIIDVDRRGVPTGDGSNTVVWVFVLAASLIAFGALSYAFIRSGRKKKKKKRSK